MKKAAIWLAVISIIVFVIDWGIVGLKLLDSNYDITLGAYIGLVSIVVFSYVPFILDAQTAAHIVGR